MLQPINHRITISRPEIPGQPAQVEGGYKDSQGRIKKQVVRFRIYGLNDNDEVIKELTADDAEITWRVHVANRKAAWYEFNNAMDLGELALPARLRNFSIQGENRQKLIFRYFSLGALGAGDSEKLFGSREWGVGSGEKKELINVLIANVEGC